MTTWAAPSGYRLRSVFFGDIDAVNAQSVQSAINYAQSQFDFRGALDYIRKQWASFQNIGGVLTGLQHQAGQLAAQAAAVGRTDIQQDLQSRINYLGSLNAMAGSILDEYAQLQQGLQNMGYDISGNPLSTAQQQQYGSGQVIGVNTIALDTTGMPVDSTFGQEPISATAATALAILIAGSILYITFHTSEQAAAIQTQQKILGMVSSGQLTAQQATQLARTAADTSAQSTSTGLSGVMNALKGIAWPVALGVLGVVVVPQILKKVGGRRR